MGFGFGGDFFGFGAGFFARGGIGGFGRFNQDVRHAAFGFQAAFAGVVGCFDFGIAHALLDGDVFGRKHDVFKFCALRQQIVFFVGFVVFFQCGIVCFHFVGKGLRVQHIGAGGTGGEHGVDDLLRLEIRHGVAV